MDIHSPIFDVERQENTLANRVHGLLLVFFGPLGFESVHLGIDRDAFARALVLSVVEPVTLIVAEHGHTFGYGRRIGDFRRLGCVPIGYTGHFIGQMVAMAVLDGDPNLLFEAHGVLNVEDVTALITLSIGLVDARSVS